MPSYILNTTRLSALMNEHSLSSLTQLGELAGVHRNTLYPLTRGERSPFSESFLAICSALNVAPEELIARRDNPEIETIKEISETVVSEFRVTCPTLAIFLFGSRARRTAKRYSDYDIGLTGGQTRIAAEPYLRIRERILQLGDDLPVTLDILNFDSAPNSILADFSDPLILLAGDPLSLAFLQGVIYGSKSD